MMDFWTAAFFGYGIVFTFTIALTWNPANTYHRIPPLIVAGLIILYLWGMALALRLRGDI